MFVLAKHWQQNASGVVHILGVLLADGLQSPENLPPSLLFHTLLLRGVEEGILSWRCFGREVTHRLIYFLGLQGIMGFDSWQCLPPCCGRPLIADLYHFKMLNTLLGCPITTELFQKNGYGFNACNNESDILYNTDIISSVNWLFTVLWIN